MFAALRAFAKSWVAAVLMGLLIVSFAVWGIRDVFRGRISGDAVVTAGSRTVSSTDYRREFEQFKSRVEQQTGQQIPNDVAAANGLDREVLQGLATREAFAELIHKLGIIPSDKLVAEQIAKIPAFFDPVTGRFDKRAYQQALANNDLNPVRFEAEMRDDIAQQHLGTAIIAGLAVPRAYTAMAAVFELEGRDVAFLAIDPKSVPQPAPPTDAQLTTFMQENATAIMRPEFRQLTLLQVTPEQFMASVKVDPAQVQKQYDFRKDTLSKPETRTLVQIPAKSPAAAAQITARLAKGEDPAAVAKAFGVDAITYADKPQSAIPDKKLAAVAFQMQPGQVQTVQGELALAVVKLQAVTPGHVVTFEEARPGLEAEVRKNAASEKVYQLTQAYDDAHEKGASLPEAAQKAGIPTTTLGPVAKNGLGPDGKPVPGLTQKLVDAAFALPAGGESELEDNGAGGYFAVRVDKVIPPALPSLAEIKPKLTQAWIARELNERLAAKADELAARVRKGESLEAVAASSGAKVVRVNGLTRATAGQNQALSGEILARVFDAKLGDVFTARTNGVGYVVGKLAAIHAGEGANLPLMAEAARGQMTTAYIREVEDAARAAARGKIKVTLDPERARAALGLELAGPAKPAPGQ